MNLKAIQYRLQFDFQLAVMTLLCAIAVVGIAPFAVLRAVNEQWLAFTVDMVIEAGTLACMIYAWRTGDSHRPSLVLAYFVGAMAIVAIYVLGPAGKYWFYPAIVANFFLVERRHALLIALAGLAVIFLGGGLNGSPLTEIASYLVTATVCALLGYAFAYRTAMQRTQLEALASKDPLTGLFNRRTLLEALQSTHRDFARDGETRGLLVVDLDHFKHINDSYGHLTGDQVLVTLAQQLEQNVRTGDRLFRYGGEEFIVLTLPKDKDGLAIMAENLRSAIARNLDDGHGHGVTASLGGALLRPGEAVQDWFARADTALYVAKNAGRNQVVIDPGQ
ncbi:MAG: diguanylate cyclase [Rhodocyclales bacterium]|nr:diguanylate cyclase [Rhodocyclales bacterium]